MTHEVADLLRFYSHFHCTGCDYAWVIQKLEKGAMWRPLSSISLPYEDRVASLREKRYRNIDKTLLRVINIHTGDFVMAAVL